jgi:ABC-type phosphate transport system permease subunit
MALHLFVLATETRAFDKAMGVALVLIVTIVILNLFINYTSRTLASRAMGSK